MFFELTNYYDTTDKVFINFNHVKRFFINNQKVVLIFKEESQEQSDSLNVLKDDLWEKAYARIKVSD